MTDIYILTVTFYSFQSFFYVSYNFVIGAAASLGSDTLAKEILFISMRLEKKRLQMPLSQSGHNTHIHDLTPYIYPSTV